LEELIARQRFSLNRTVQLEKHFTKSGQIDSAKLDHVIRFERNLAELTQALAKGYKALELDAAKFLIEAEGLMLASVNSLGDKDFGRAAPQQKDALVCLIKARDTVRQFLNRCSPSQARAFQSFSRTRAQKLRAPKDKREEVRKLPARLRQLADQERFVYATLTGIESGDANRQELKRQQQKTVEEAYAIRRSMEDIKALTTLPRERMARAATRAEQVSDALTRGNSMEASRAAEEAESMFRELAEHVEGLLAEETADRVAAARDLAHRLTQRERQFGDHLQDRPRLNGGRGSRASSGDSDLVHQAARLTESGRTLEDLLKALAEGAQQDSPGTSREIQQLLGEGELERAILRMQQIERLLQAGDFHAASMESRDIADSLDALNLKLDSLHRLIVTPQIEELMTLQRRVGTLRERLKALESEFAIDEWHHDADAVLSDLVGRSAVQQDTDRLLRAMREAGWSDPSATGWNWGRVDDAYVAPEDYGTGLDAIVLALQQRIRELILKDLMISQDEATPPEYKELVDRYFQVLYQDGGSY